MALWLRIHKKQILLCLLTLLIFIGVGVGFYFILKSVGFNADKLKTILDPIGMWKYPVFIIIQVLVTTLLCIIPATSTMFITAAVGLFEWYEAIIIVVIGVFLSSMLMFFIGDKCGEKVAVKIVGREALEKAQSLIDTHATVLLPFMFLFPIFPDDALCLAAGMTKMKYWYFALISLIFRSIGAVCMILVETIFKEGILNWMEWSLTDWIIIINLILIDIYFIIKIIKYLEKKLINYKNKARKSQQDNSSLSQDA